MTFSVNDQVVYDGSRGTVLERLEGDHLLVLVNGAELTVHSSQLSLYERPELTPGKPLNHWLWREKMRLWDALANDPAVAIHNSRIEPLHHQVGVVLRALERARPRMVLADEVGLGKTIEAGLILKEMRARGLVERVLIVVPSNVRTQWQTELSTKFNEEFEFVDSKRLRELRTNAPNGNPWERAGGNIIVSLEIARREENRDLIAALDWDLVVVDEAHRARVRGNSKNLGFQLLSELRDCGALLLLTATPMQLEPSEFFSMLHIVQPGLFPTMAAYEASMGKMVGVNEALRLTRAYPRSDDDQRLYLAHLTLLEAPEEVLGHAASSTSDGDLAVVRWLETQHPLSEVMTRNRKVEIGGFQVRVANVLAVTRSAAEVQLDLALQQHITDMREALGTKRGRHLHLLLSTYRKMLASSTAAFESTLERRLAALEDRAADTGADAIVDDSDEDEQITDALQAAADAELEKPGVTSLLAAARKCGDSKADVLERELDRYFTVHPEGKILIFTQYVRTMDMLLERLEGRFSVGVFNGSQSVDEKDRAFRRFRDTNQILISTEAGGEGRNFQFCHVLVNYDLPWNPIKVEQRIGRLDRYGQKHPVQIYNFHVEESLDGRVFELLSERIRLFEQSVGPLEPILGDVEAEIREIALAPPEEAEQRWRDLEISLDEKIRRAEETEQRLAKDLMMDERSMRRDAVNEILDRAPRATADDVEAFVLRYLERFRETHSDVVVEHQGVYTFSLPDILMEAARQGSRRLRLKRIYTGTFDVQRAIANDDLEFFALGHPLIEAISREVDARFVADAPYAVITRGTRGAPELVVDYEILFSGVEFVREHVAVCCSDAKVDEFRGAIPCPNGISASAPKGFDLAAAIEACDREARRIAAVRFERFQDDDTRHRDELVQRLQGIAEYQIENARQRIEAEEARLVMLRLLDGPSSAQRGQITRAENVIEKQRARIRAAETDRDTLVKRAVDTPSPTFAHQRLSATLLV